MRDFKVTVKSVYDGHHKITYNGVEAIKCPFDYVMYQMILFDLKPDLVIEIGSNKGGGALYIADLLSIIGKGVVHTIDIADNFDKKVIDHPRIRTFICGYEEYDLSLLHNFERILVIEDASHTYQDCLNCLDKFSPIVTLGSYYIIEDGIIDKLGMKKRFSGGPKKAIKEFLDKNQTFEIDQKWIHMFGNNATFNINGYLKKVK
jgi:cephalosporin hydroxylase